MGDSFMVFVVLGLILFGAIAFVSYYFSKDAKTRRSLAGAERTTIAGAEEGALVKISGELVLRGDPIESPLSQRPCAAWEVRVEERRSSGKSSHWHTIIQDQHAVDFLVEDDSGRALVRAIVPQMALEQDGHFRSGTFEDAPPALEGFLAEHGHTSTGLLGFNKSMRYREGALEAGERVTVLGVCRWEPDPDPAAAGAGGYRKGALRLVVEPPPEGRLLISDDPSVGK